MADFDLMQEAVARVRERAPNRSPKVGIVLGSGLGAFADRLESRVAIPYEDLPHFPKSSVVGHAGKLVLGEIGGEPVVAMQGRVHYYEGFSASQVVFPIRVLCALGIHTLVVTNAAGGINRELAPGDLMAITDHLNLSGFNPLVGPNDERFGPRFPDMSEPYGRALTRAIVDCGRKLGTPVREGVYAVLSGPSYETPAEIRMLRTLGADAVGMSTVPEVIAARHMGVQVAGVSCITNLAAGIGEQPLSHEEVSETASRVREVFCQLLAAFLPQAARMPPPKR
jgi:purine-nucleoside phosphorylase